MKKYIRRVSDAKLQMLLECTGAVLIEGPKWCGKTSSCEHFAKSIVYFQDPDNRNNYLKISENKPSLLLRGDVPRLIDEWQTIPKIWDAVRFEVDKRGENGQFLLTGSAVPLDDVVMHSGTGRIARMRMHTMSLFESGESNGEVSLWELFNGKMDIEAVSNLTLEGIAAAIARGGWPLAVSNPRGNVYQHAVNYVEAIINEDVSRVDGIEKNPQRVRKLLMSLARNISTLATVQTIKSDVASGDNDILLTEKTIARYLTALDRIFVTENIPAWSPNLRSKSAIRTSPKRQFTDPSIAVATLRITPQRLFDDFNYFGFLFESLCERDLRVYAEANDGSLYHYRDSSGLEIDAIISLNDGRWGAAEIKLGTTETEEAAKNLLKLSEKMDYTKMQKPSFLMVVNGSEYAYQRKDGVLVVPIGTLKD